MSGNPWIAQQREQAFRAELNDKGIWINVAAMLLSEGSPLQTCESLFNRVMYVRSYQPQTIMQMITGGFYGPYNRGEYPTFIDRIRESQATVNQLNTAIETAMAGSDTIEGYTDQGLPTDPNGQHQPQIHIGGNIFNDWGGGPGGHAGAAAWREQFEASAAKGIPVTTPTPTPAPVPAPTPVAPAPTPTPTPTPAPAPAATDPIPGIIAMLTTVQGWLPVITPFLGPYGAAANAAIPLAEDVLKLIEQIKTGQNVGQVIAAGLQTIGSDLQTIGTALPKD